jgi:hypothetical protein
LVALLTDIHEPKLAIDNIDVNYFLLHITFLPDYLNDIELPHTT